VEVGSDFHRRHTTTAGHLAPMALGSTLAPGWNTHPISVSMTLTAVAPLASRYLIAAFDVAGARLRLSDRRFNFGDVIEHVLHLG